MFYLQVYSIISTERFNLLDAATEDSDLIEVNVVRRLSQALLICPITELKSTRMTTNLYRTSAKRKSETLCHKTRSVVHKYAPIIFPSKTCISRIRDYGLKEQFFSRLPR